MVLIRVSVNKMEFKLRGSDNVLPGRAGGTRISEIVLRTQQQRIHNGRISPRSVNRLATGSTDLETRGTGSGGGSDDRSDCVPHMWHRAARGRTGLRSCGSLIARLPAPHVDHRLAPVLNQNGAAFVLVP